MTPERESQAAASARLLNFGRSAAFHPEWTYLDAAPVSPRSITRDLRRTLLSAADCFDEVYGSHVLDRLHPSAGAQLLWECFGALAPGGIVRIVVPDLEAIASLYLPSPEGALSRDADAKMRYEWIMLEPYDQGTRAGTRHDSCGPTPALGRACGAVRVRPHRSGSIARRRAT